MASELTKSITTSLPKDEWKMAVASDISWSKALRVGISAMIGVNKEKKALEKEKELVEAKLKYINEQLDEIKNKEKEEEKARQTIIVR